MILKKVLIRYYSNNMLKTKNDILEILKKFGIFELELIENFSDDVLDYTENIQLVNQVWAIIFYLPNNRFFTKKLKMIEDEIKIIEDIIYEVYTSELNTDSYKDEWKKSFHTTKITENIVVNPSWEEYEQKDNEIVIHIDPAMAFGTGTHETTALCIELLEKYARGDSLLDLGCGSGILMLIAKKLGYKKVVGIDIDENCLEVVKDNFLKNDISSGYEVYIGDIKKYSFEKFSVIVSNILVDVLEKILPNIIQSMTDSTYVIFSGILQEKKDSFISYANEYGLELVDEKIKNKWIGLVFKLKDKR
ncbi:50S ribosomal protein L11 methyltransferase [Sneathia sp. DSM 16631]|uniref:50S ribosomal protein L11 methyltransferase n=1 Tax=Sneathia TaxID=168808 RepID=UPI0018690118|nr:MULTISPECIES: 50S ribosomal protein L11 methyltransferase [Sneathia]MBE3030900.1 50S ribosomal protein L11 methyltransferase [Sneathia sp. DSM 16631]MDK9582403.1 50S ribosomal protein L11 methyltransferase [Sneathia vaginalis]